MKHLLCLIALLAFAGCTNLPTVSAKRIHYQSSYPIGGTTIDMQNVKVSETHVRADSYKRTSRWWYFAQDVQIEGYDRERSDSK